MLIWNWLQDYVETTKENVNCKIIIAQSAAFYFQ